jgi:hypothetical protein
MNITENEFDHVVSHIRGNARDIVQRLVRRVHRASVSAWRNRAGIERRLA